MARPTPSSDWCTDPLAQRLWQRSAALAWMLDVPPLVQPHVAIDAPWTDDRMVHAHQFESELERQDDKRSA